MHKQSRRALSRRLILYSVGIRQRISENSDFGCFEGKHYKQKSDNTKQSKSKLWIFAGGFLALKSACFVYIGNRGGNKENCYIQPVG